ncbi:MAG: FAD-binding oxidoreductase, partial [Planctomycetota bacterium]
RNLLWAGRRGAFGAIARLAPNYLVADCTVPRNRLPEALARVAAIAEGHRLEHGNVFHAGDGNLHPLLLFDSRDSDQLQRVHQAGEEIMQACVELGGTISGEHGIGAEKLEAMRLICSPHDLGLQRSLRGAFDPDDLLNPGKILPPDGDGGKDLAEPGSAEKLQGAELAPADVAEACEMVRRAYLDRTALLPLGNGGQLDCGNRCQGEPTALRSTRLSYTAEYDPANQVVAVGSGTCLGALQEMLAEHGQWLPVRPPRGDEGTLGGLAALGSCGPERLRYGGPRDLLLGLKFVSGAGRPISAGGRVVKNVAGYDLTRLLAGSAGTLGFVTELTFRAASLPECCTALAASGSLERCSAAATELLRSKLEPVFVVAVPGGAALRLDGDRAWRLIAGFEGFRETVEFQVGGCEALFRQAGLGAEGLREYTAREGVCGEFFGTLRRSPFLLRADLPLDQVSAFVSAAGEMLPGAAMLVDLGCGRIVAAVPTLTPEGWLRSCAAAKEMEGHVVLEKASGEFARQHDVFGLPRPSWHVMHRVKAALDPHNVFAPGRLPGRK